MNNKLRDLLNTIQQSAHLSEDEKSALLKQIKSVDKELEITAFKLDRTEKVKRTTSILLEETIEALEQKRKSVEAQNHELEVEAALERVRTVAMSMSKVDDLLLVCEAQFNELKALGFAEMRNALIGIFNDQQNYINDYDYSDFAGGNIHKIPYHKNAVIDSSLKQMKSATDAFTEFIVEGKELEEWKAFRKQNGEYDDTRIKDVTILYYYFYSISQGNVGISTFQKISEGQLLILKRFRNVFDLAYKRYVDITNAEAQARDAKIEASLEKVRSRSLAMHKSDELQEVVNTLFERLKALDIEMNVASIFIFKKDTKDWQQWVATSTTNYSTYFHLPYLDNAIFRDLEEAKQSGKDFYSFRYSFEQKNEWFNYAFNNTEYNRIPDERKKFLLESEFYQISFALSKNTGLQLAKYSGDNFSENDNEIIKRFSKVFEQAYIRFLDLQKAEAQAKESQIQLALERARTQSMIMQHSRELDDTLRVFHEQVLQLGIPSAFSFLWLPDEEKNRHIFWAAWAENNSTVFKSKAIDYPLDRNEPATAQCLIDWKSDVAVVAYHVPPASVKDYFAAWSELIAGADELSSENFSDGLYYVEAFMKYGCFGVIVKNTLPEDEKKILDRFSVEFERAYTRFLDLQKSEAQAREAQIEAALERVRSRSMGMQKSEELKEVIQVVYDQFVYLNIHIDHAGFVVDYKPKDAWHFWIADKQEIPSKITHPYFDSVWANQFDEAKEKGIDFFATHLDFEEKNKFYHVLLSLIPGLAEEVKEFYFSCPGLAGSTVLLENVALYIENFDGIPYTDEENKTLMRFGKVFQQTYTRFLDLQKAEAQARESQIEAALEKVRSRSLAMHRSDELSEVVSIVCEKLQALDFSMQDSAAIIFIFIEGSKDFIQWISEPDRAYATSFKIPYNDNPLTSDIFKAKENGKDFLSKLYPFEIKNKYFNFLFKQSDYRFLPNEIKKLVLESKTYGFSIAFAKNSAILIPTNTGKLLSENEAEILKRFSRVFEQAYVRFLDLQKAEAQSREAQIEAALERVRSRTLAMQKSDELAETSAVLFKQLITLGIEPHRLYLSIMKDDEGETEFWITDEDGSKVSSAYTDNLNDNASFKKMYDGWKAGKQSVIIDLKGKELNDYFQHLTSLGVPFKDGLKQKRRIQHLAFFNRGFIGMAAPDDQPKETIHLLERFAAVFNLTFTRFNDLKIAEAHAVQAEQDLIEIKVARKNAEEALNELQVTQNQLIQKEKMASLGELTAGIAHEIQNPLNFVNNFSEVSKELLVEMKAALENGDRNEAEEIANDIIQNLEKINHHGRRADAIVKGMLQHSRQTSGKKEPTDINALCDEYLRLSYHGLRAKDKSFNADFRTDFDAGIDKIKIVPQDVGRVLLNLFNNAFYATNEKFITHLNADYKPLVSIQTKKINDSVEITVSDNGNGIPQNIIDKIFQPFFTTKPTGQGTGLGLSLSYDIITKEHNGTLRAGSKEGEGSRFIIQLPVLPT